MESYKDKIYEQFKIPIKYIQHNTLNNSLINDLELVKFNTTDNSNNLIDISNNNTIYHKYYEPLSLIMVFILFNNLDYRNFFSKKRNLIYLYGFSLFYIFLRIFKKVYLI